MDVNGLPMWLISGKDGFGLGDSAATPSASSALQWDSDKHYLRLASQQKEPSVTEDEAFARLMLSLPAPVCDAAGTFAWWDANMGTIFASGFGEGSTPLEVPSAPGEVVTNPSDIALGNEQILYIARNSRVEMADLRGRYPNIVVEHDRFSTDLVAPAADGGAWLFDKARGVLGRLNGYPLRLAALLSVDRSRFQPKENNPNPPKVRILSGARIGSNFSAVALAVSAAGKVALLAWETGADAILFLLKAGRLEPVGRTKGLQFPWSLAWQGESRLAILASDGKSIAKQAFVYSAELMRGEEGELLPEGRFYPLSNAHPLGFCNSLGTEARYLASPLHGAVQLDSEPTEVRRLIALSGDGYARQGEVLIGPIDSCIEGTVWHRIYLDASVRGQSSMMLSFHATDQRVVPLPPGQAKSPAWAPHRIGRSFESLGIPQAAWCDVESEIPGANSFLGCSAKPDEAGLFTLLLQHSDRRVRRISGRYGWLHLKLEGGGTDSPELSAIRIYANRLSYRDAYLPDFYSETLSGAEAERQGSASAPDFLERMLSSFEGSLTEIEGRIAGAWRLTDPATTTKEALPWVGSWLGVDDDSDGNPDRLRQTLLAAPYRRTIHGALGGLLTALEIATGGRVITGGQIDNDNPPEKVGSLVIARLSGQAVRGLLLGVDGQGRCAILIGGGVTKGDIVVVEGFRLRRTFATILGADLADEDDPLTLGLATSGNSFVGDTLILGEQALPELVALYRADLDFAADDQDAVRTFFAKLAHRVIILVRNVEDPSEMRRLRDVAERHSPAHVEPQLFASSTPLIVGAASLVGVDTYLTASPKTERVRLGHTLIGSGDQIRNEGWLDDRADGPMQKSPSAFVDGPQTVWRGAPFLLSGLRSRADGNRSINRYIWTWEE